jgi:hypothetical protein
MKRRKKKKKKKRRRKKKKKKNCTRIAASWRSDWWRISDDVSKQVIEYVR